MPKHLTAASRDKIEVLLQENYSIKQIADKLSVHKTYQAPKHLGHFHIK